MTKRPSNPMLTSRGLARTVIHHCVDGLLVIDAEGVVQFANPAAILLFADKTSDLVGFHLGMPAIDEPVEIILPNKDSARYVEMRSSEIVWAGRPASLACLRDITDRKRVEEAASKQADELLERNRELLRFNRAAVERELRMIELKQEVNQLCLMLGRAVRHRIAGDEAVRAPATPVQNSIALVAAGTAANDDPQCDD